MAHIAKRTASGALVTHDHEGGRTLAKALANVGAGSLFTDCVELVLTQDALDIVKTRPRCGRLDADPFGFF